MEDTMAVVSPDSAPAGMAQWAERGACRGTDPDALFVQGAAQNRAKHVCLSCVVRTECLADSLDNRIEFGVWGGMTERERRALLKRRPNVRSWRRLLETARAEHERTLGVAEPQVEVVRSA
jgi:WhiB family redox-sensing transcriptional regulator